MLCCAGENSLLLVQSLTVAQIKKVQALIEEANERSNAEMKECEEERLRNLVMIGNLLHESVPVSNDEVWEGSEVHAGVCGVCGVCVCVVCVCVYTCVHICLFSLPIPPPLSLPLSPSPSLSLPLPPSLSLLQETGTVVERMHGPCKFRKKYSHVDLIVMVDGADMHRGTMVAGNRCYYLKGVLGVGSCVGDWEAT